MGFIKAHKTLLTRILCVVLSAALGVLCASCVADSAEVVWSELSEYSSYVVSTQSQIVGDENIQSQPSQPEKPPMPTIINAVLPYQKQTLAAGSTFTVIASARPDSSEVTATFNGETISLKRQEIPEGTSPEFVDFIGEFTLPLGNEDDVNLGGVTFYVKWQNYSKKLTSPSVICLRDTALDRVMIVEIVGDTAETFDGNTTDDNSDPRLSYLPKGTVDFKVGKTVYDAKSGNSYYKLRFGRRVYVTKKNPPDERIAVSTLYEGTVPDSNEISLASNYVSGSHTYLTFDTAWKAPFTLDVAPQNYTNPSARDFTINSATYSYVDIKFCYTSAIGGDITIPSDNPLFSSAQIIAQEGGYVLRLHLKKAGGFYGWDCYYNNSGQLVFKFLNPKKITSASNEYGTNLSGVNVLVDVGHGGRDIGAGGLMPDIIPESNRNLLLALKLKTELESMGAKVTLTRSSDVAVTVEGRGSLLRKTAPDICVSIHHDSSESKKNNGCGVFCFNAFSHNATTSVLNSIARSGIYSNTYKKWHYFHLARNTTCPVVLTENGFISNPTDFIGISDDNVNTKKAKAIAQGIADYFWSIQ